MGILLPSAFRLSQFSMYGHLKIMFCTRCWTTGSARKLKMKNDPYILTGPYLNLEFCEPKSRSSFSFVRACLNEHWQYLIYCLLKTGLYWIVCNHALHRKCTMRVPHTAKENLKDLRVGCVISYNWSWV